MNDTREYKTMVEREAFKKRMSKWSVVRMVSKNINENTRTDRCANLSRSIY